MPITIVAARREELAGMLRPGVWQPLPAPGEAQVYRRRSDGVLALLAGGGRRRTEASLSWLLEQHPPEAIVAVGFAGGCTDSMDVGDLLLATQTHSLEGSPFDWVEGSLDEGIPADAPLLERARDAVELIGIDFVSASAAEFDLPNQCHRRTGRNLAEFRDIHFSCFLAKFRALVY